jgi:alpha-1,6-mannosyltransferase
MGSPSTVPEATDWSPGVTTALATVGTIGMVLVALGGVIAGPIGPTGSEVEHIVRDLIPRGTTGTVLASTSSAVGLVLVLGAWVVLGLLLRVGAPLRPLVRISVLWSLPLVLGPPLYSRDAYSYAALGQMVTQHLDPYRFGPALLGSSPFVTPVGSVWRYTATPYGPLFLKLSAAAVTASGDNVVRAILTMRVLEIVGVALIGLSLPKLAQVSGKDPARALWLGVCNPLVLIHFIGGAHNDALMLGLMLCGLAVAATGRPAWGIVLCVLGGAIKFPAAIGAAFIVFEVVRALPAGKRLVEFVRLSAVGLGSFVGITLFTGLGFGWIKALAVPGTNHLLLTPSVFVAHWISTVVGHDEAVLNACRAFGTVATIVGVLYFLWRAPRFGTVRACGLALAVVVVCGPVVLPWYALWPVIVLAPAGKRIERGFAIFASVVLTIVVQPSGSAQPDWLLMSAVVLLTAVFIALAWRPFRSWVRHDLAVAIDECRQDGRMARVVDIVRRARPNALTKRSAVVDSRAA